MIPTVYPGGTTVSQRRLCFKKELFFAESRPELIQPGCLRIVFGEKRLLDPLWIAGLDKAQYEDTFTPDVGHTLEFDFTRVGTHGGSPRGAAPVSYTHLTLPPKA